MAKQLKRSQETQKDERDIFYYVMRLRPEDKKVIQAICPYTRQRGRKTRLEVFDELAPIVRGLKFPKSKPPKRQLMRLGLPKALVIALQNKADTTKKPMIELLVMAAREYAKANNIDIPTSPSQ